MSAIVLDAIAADVALLTSTIDAPTDGLGYGTDISCTNDLAEDGGDVDPMSVEAISQALLRMYDCPLGGIYGDPEYVSMDLRARLNRGVTTTEVRSLEDEMRTIAVSDDRVSSATVAVTLSASGRELTATIEIVPEDPTRLDPFRLVIVATDATLLLEEMSAS